MHDYDIQTTLEDFGRHFEDRLSSLEKKGQEDSVLQEKITSLESHLDQTERRLKQMDLLANRPRLETTEEPFRGHTRAFMEYIRKGLDAQLHEYERKSLSTTPDANGGYLVPSGLHDHLYTTLQATSVMRGLASVREISSSALEMLIDKDSADVGWVAETEDRKETKTPELAKIRIPVHEMYALSLIHI